MRRSRGRRHAVALALLLPFAASCFSRPHPPDERPTTVLPAPPRAPERVVPAPEPLPADIAPPGPTPGSGPLVRVALRVPPDAVALAANGPWRLLDDGGSVLVRARADERWRLERRGTRLRAVRDDGTATGWQSGELTLFADDSGLVLNDARAYRGALAHLATDSGILVINTLPLDEYLRGVVPLEIGDRTPVERAAVEAQAVAARSYTVTRLASAAAGGGRTAAFDLLSSVADQAYGGRDAERPLSDAAVRNTAGLVLLYAGRVVTAPFFSACGGETAAAQDVWRTAGEPHLRRVSDRIPGSDRYYCDIAPRFAWTRAFTGTELDAVVRRYLAEYATVGSGGPGRVSDLTVADRTPSGRVGTLVVRTDRGSYRVRGNDARSVLRSPGGELLNSSYFSVTTERSGGRLVRALIRGNGYGHGVGMCQWGAIGRARAGQDLRTILRTYYPGTTVGPIPPRLLNP